LQKRPIDFRDLESRPAVAASGKVFVFVSVGADVGGGVSVGADVYVCVGVGV